MEGDELELEKIGDRKTARFCIVSDTDMTFNFTSKWYIIAPSFRGEFSGFPGETVLSLTSHAPAKSAPVPLLPQAAGG